ncbi:MAG: 3-deoxy-manno-octulosonate cytidylyltransferase [Limnobacter sp.]|nr:3-deoxy-manno-octulosonate cytidylyltransferase [Limnobacter sp.]
MFKAVIPARFASVRLPGKPLLDLAGKPMVVRVAEQAARSKANEILVATDHADIAQTCKEHGIDCLMTRKDWPTGTDRLAEVAAQRGWSNDTVVVNVQGDEPLLDPALINLVAQTLLEGDQAIATCGHPIHSEEEFLNPNVVKIAMANNGEALYFSRAPIPWPRQAMAAQRQAQADAVPLDFEAIRHIGLYAYRCGFLKKFQELAPAVTEQQESLEQLRALAHGHRIKVCMIQHVPDGGVDTPEDLERVRQVLSNRPQ